MLPRRMLRKFIFGIVFLQPMWTVSETIAEASERLFIQGFLDELSVVHPIRLDSNGEFLTHNLHFVNALRVNNNFRRKRDLGDVEMSEISRLLYSIPIGDHQLTLNLTENEELVAPNFVVETIKGIDPTSGEPISSSFTRGTQWPCLFQGHVEGDALSRVALSTCHGLTGLIVTEEGEFFLEPAEPYANVKDGSSQAHKIYRRDLSKIVDKAEPMLHFEKTASDENREPLKRLKIAEGNKGDGSIAEFMYPANYLSGHSSDEFCGVSDTKSRYRHIIRRREQWEEHHGRDRHRGHNAKNREKRSVSVDRMIEMLVVADKSMVDYHEASEHGGLEKYVLTIVNMVSELFKDASIGNALHVSIVRLILLGDEEKGPKITSDAEKTLDRFCKWAKKINPKGDDHPNHHDVAVLLTRKVICSQANKSCETLGLAHVAGMCQSHRSCSLNQDVGLSLAYTVTHEIGHNFAMHHDGQMNDCKPNPKYNYVMSPHLTSSKLQMRWSSCSRRYITRFLDRNWGFCLNDKPADHPEFTLPTALPGVIYDADHQCRLMFGEGSKHCYGIDDMCDRLWCVIDGTCRTRLHAAVPGTKCGKNKWCLGGKCVSTRNLPTPVDGGWGTWSEWTSCSRTCGIGVSSSIRHCDNPAPENGGNYCTGERKRYKTCSKWRCRESEGSLSFRAQQCSHYNDLLYKNKTFAWKPVESALYPCELHCYTRSGTFYFADRMRDKVTDGTPCFPESDDICVDGICRRLGCDKNLGSRALEDRCGVCHGNGSTCYEVNTMFSRKTGEEYSPAALLPRGARNIEILETESVSNFLALRHATNKTLYYLNGNYIIQWNTIFQLAGTQFSYRRENETRDIITAPGPLTTDVMLMILFVEENPGVSIEYSMPYDVDFDPSPGPDYPEFSWKVRGWTDCTTECGTGSRSLDIVCEEIIAGVVEEFYCNETERPPDEKRPCNEIPCPPRWRSSKWEPCSVTCGSRRGVQRRTVDCVRSVGEEGHVKLNESYCTGLERPDDRRKCRIEPYATCPMWKTGKWRGCSRSCGGGVKNRTVKCVTQMNSGAVAVTDTPIVAEIDFIDRKPRKGRKRTKHENLPGIGLIKSVERELIDVQLDEEEFNVEDDSECDSSLRPIAQRQCMMTACPSTTSSETETNDYDLTTGDEIVTLPIFDETTLPADEEYHEITANDTSQHVTESIPIDSKTEFERNNSTSDLPAPVGLLSDRHRKPVHKEQATTRESLAGDSLRDEYISEENVKLETPERVEATQVSMEDGQVESTFTVTTLPFVVSKDVVEVLSTPQSGSPRKRATSSAGNLLRSSISNDIDEFDVGEILKDKPKPSGSVIDQKFQPHENMRDLVDNGNPDTDGRNLFDIDDPMIDAAPTERKPTIVPNLRDVDLDFDVIAGSFDNKEQPPTTRKTITSLESSVTGHDTTKQENGAVSTLPTKSQSESDKTVTESTSNHVKGDWIVGEWSKCSVTCGLGAKVRQVRCSVQNEKLCNVTDRPAPAIICSLRPCAKWVYGEWSKCSTLCGTGTRTKSVQCVDERTKKVLRPHHCLVSPKLSPVEVSCHESNCLRWKTSRWTSCSKPCGSGVQRRRVVCQRPGQCDSSLKPHGEKSCFARLCVDWKPLKWNKCSVHCGGGIRRRQIICVERETGVKTNTSLCQPGLRPHRTERCNQGQCPVTDYDFSNCHADRLSLTFCVLLQKMGRCLQPSLAIQCCVTCKTYLSVRIKDKMS